VIDLDTAKAFAPVRAGVDTVVTLAVPIVDDKQSAHIQITGTLKDPSYKVMNGDLVFERTLHGLRNTVLLPAGWDVAAVSQSGTIGTYEGRAFVALINLNAENNYGSHSARKRSCLRRVASDRDAWPGFLERMNCDPDRDDARARSRCRRSRPRRR
jgi:hypothetical protein